LPQKIIFQAPQIPQFETMRLPILPALVTASLLPCAPFSQAAETNGYHEFNYGATKQGAEDWVQSIRVIEPSPRSEIQGDVTVKFRAPGMTEATPYCWQQPTEAQPNPWGHDEKITPAPIVLDAAGNGDFIFPADQFPNGPVNVRIFATNKDGKKDIYELQLFNKGGVKWNQGIPSEIPPGARGMQLIFQDDFDRPLSISNDGRGATYMAHKPGGGDFSGWEFSDILGEGKPFAQVGTWLKIAARKDEESPAGRSGIIASVNRDLKGIWAKAPCYFECRFIAQSAMGTWPAFWTLALTEGEASDELDIIEAYGAMGPGNPNHHGYSIVSHFWRQQNPDGTNKKSFSARPEIMKLGGKSYWSTTFHTYAVSIGLEETVYYFDNIEVLRHPTGEISRDYPHFFLINLALGGLSRWPINLERYADGTDMWVDYVRVFAREPVAADYQPRPISKPDIAVPSIGLSFAAPGNGATEMQDHDAAGMPGFCQANWNNLTGPSGKYRGAKDSDGKVVEGMQLVWTAQGSAPTPKEQKAFHFDFKFSQLVLMSGHLPGRASLEVTGVPYKTYDVLVYLAAAKDNEKSPGQVTLKSNGSAQTIHYLHEHLKGRYVASKALGAAQAQPSNLVIFKALSGDTFTLDWDGTHPPAPSGVAAVQIVSAP
jgi:hypothetical protein